MDSCFWPWLSTVFSGLSTCPCRQWFQPVENLRRSSFSISCCRCALLTTFCAQSTDLLTTTCFLDLLFFQVLSSLIPFDLLDHHLLLENKANFQHMYGFKYHFLHFPFCCHLSVNWQWSIDRLYSLGVLTRIIHEQPYTPKVKARYIIEISWQLGWTCYCWYIMHWVLSSLEQWFLFITQGISLPYHQVWHLLAWPPLDILVCSWIKPTIVFIL